MVFGGFPQVQKSSKTDAFLKMFAKSEQNHRKFNESPRESTGVIWRPGGATASKNVARASARRFSRRRVFQGQGLESEASRQKSTFRSRSATIPG